MAKMGKRKTVPPLYEEDEWQYSGPSSSLPNEGTLEIISSRETPVADDDAADWGSTIEPPAFDPTLLMGDSDGPSGLSWGRDRFQLLVPPWAGVSIVVACVLVVCFGVIGSFYTSFKKPRLESFRGWSVHSYLQKIGKEETATVQAYRHFQEMYRNVENPMNLSSELQVLTQQTGELYVSVQKLHPPVGYELMQNVVQNAITSEMNTLTAFQNYISTNTANDHNVWLSSNTTMFRSISWMKTEWRKVR